MNQNFELDITLAIENATITDLKLNQVLLHNNSLFPWVILVPKHPHLREVIDLKPKDRSVLMDEISLVSEVMMEVFKPDKLNIATLGNLVPQLHIHIIARYKHDSSWPQTVFGRETKKYEPNELKNRIIILERTIMQKI